MRQKNWRFIRFMCGTFKIFNKLFFSKLIKTIRRFPATLERINVKTSHIIFFLQNKIFFESFPFKSFFHIFVLRKKTTRKLLLRNVGKTTNFRIPYISKFLY